MKYLYAKVNLNPGTLYMPNKDNQRNIYNDCVYFKQSAYCTLLYTFLNLCIFLTFRNLFS